MICLIGFPSSQRSRISNPQLEPQGLNWVGLGTSVDVSFLSRILEVGLNWEPF